MSNENRWKCVLTNAGAALLAGAAGNKLNITRAQCGAGQLAEAEFAAQTQLNDVKASFSLMAPLHSGNTSQIRLQLKNAGINNPFELRQIGIFGALNNDSNDVLYMLLQNSEPDTIPSASQSPNYVYDCLVNLIVGSAESVTANVDTAAFVTTGGLAEVLNDYVPTSRKLNGYPLTEDIYLWAGNVGAAKEVHTHTAGDIASGVLPHIFGGTGMNDANGGAYSSPDGMSHYQIIQNKTIIQWGTCTIGAGESYKIINLPKPLRITPGTSYGSFCVFCHALFSKTSDIWIDGYDDEPNIPQPDPYKVARFSISKDSTFEKYVRWMCISRVEDIAD